MVTPPCSVQEPPPVIFVLNSQSLHVTKSNEKIPILTCNKIADNVLELLLGLAPTLLDLRPFLASQVHIDFTLAAK